MYIYRFSIIILLAILSLTTASSQDIHALISKSMQAQGKEKYEVYRQLYLLFLDSDRQTAAKYAGKMLDTSYELGDPSLQAETHLICAHLYVQLLQHERGLHHCDKALAYYQINGPDTAVGNVYLLYGTIFNTQNYLTKAAESFLRAVENFEKANYMKGKALAYMNLGITFEASKEYQRAREFYFKCTGLLPNQDPHFNEANRKLTAVLVKTGEADKAAYIIREQILRNAEKNRREEYMKDLIALGDYYFNIQRKDSSLNTYKQAFEIALEYNDLAVTSLLHTKFAHIYSTGGDWEMTLEENLQALEDRQKIGYNRLVASSLINIGGNYIQLKDFKAAEKNLTDALAIAKASNSFLELNNAYDKLAECYILSGQLNKLSSTLALHKRFKDSLSNLNNAQSASLLYSFYESEKKRQIQMLEAKNQKDAAINTVIFIVSLLALFIGFWFVNRYRMKKRTIERLISENNFIREQKKKVEEATEELARTEKRFHMLTQTTLAGVGIVNEEESFIFVNPALCTMLGYSHDELIGKNLSAISVPEEFSKYATRTENRRKGMGETYETRLRKKDGTILNVLVSATPVIDDKLGFAGTLGVITDITEKLNLIRDLNTVREKAEESDRLKSAFLANMSHEIRTPLNAILGGIMLLHQDSVDPEDQKLIQQQITHSAYYLLETWDNIITVSRLNANLFTLDKKWFQLARTVDDILTETQLSLSPEKSGLITLKKEGLDKYPELEIFSDEEVLKKILRCLISNAIKFTYQGSVTLRFIPDQARCTLEVEDTGKGMTDKELAVVFEQFRQGEEGLTRHFSGSGLGLTVARSLSELLGANIHVRTEVGKGSTFTLEIPCISKKKDKISHPEDHPGKRDWSGKTILVAEDVDSNYTLLEAILKKNKAKVLWARNGKEAIEIMRQNPDIEIILMDIQMPLLNGLEAARQIREFNQKVIIIAQTAYAMIHDRQKTLIAGCNDYITKPIRMSHLFEVMDIYLHQKNDLP